MANTLTIISSTNAVTADQFTFDLMNLPNGVPANFTAGIEALRTKGLDGTIYRETGKQHRPFAMRCVRYHATFAAAIAFARALEYCRSSFLRVESDAHGIHTNIFCNAIDTTPLTGEGAGPNITPGSQAYTVTNLSLVRS